ncbi:MAG: hypothetical protein R3264_15635, partial [Anaerolineae bacterium]|nr:hypothetical protein [Anaerolineae bacterium]
MTSGKLSKRVVALGMMVMMATMLVIFLQLTSFNPATAITTRIANENIQPMANATPREPMLDTGPSFESMSPAEALSNGKPTLFFFQPYEQCQRRYCRHPQIMADEVQAQYQGGVNFV